jgi:hypothetical protein
MLLYSFQARPCFKLKRFTGPFGSIKSTRIDRSLSSASPKAFLIAVSVPTRLPDGILRPRADSFMMRPECDFFK